MQKCKYQSVVSEADKTAALRLGRCEVCSRTERDLRADGTTLEVCGVEHYSDVTVGETIILAIPLCSDCHQQHHMNARMVFEPCPFIARQSWEMLA